MKKIIYALPVLLLSFTAQAQEQELATAAYTEAEQSFAKKNYTKALADLERCETLLGDANVKTTRLRARSLRQLAFADSAKYYAQFTSGVVAFEQLARKKKLDESSILEITEQVKSFSTDKRAYQQSELTAMVNAWPPEVLGVSINMDESSIPASIMSGMKPGKTIQGLWVRKDNDIKKTGITEIIVDQQTKKVKQVTAHTYAGEGLTAGEGANKFSQQFQKLLTAFGKENVKERIGSDKDDLKKHQVYEYSAMINPSCRYTVMYVMIGFKKWYLAESYETI